MFTIRCATTIGVAALLLAAAEARATPQIGLSWNRCDQVETAHPIVGADRVAHLFVFVDGLVGDVTGVEASIWLSPDYGYNCACGLPGSVLPAAWSFEAGGCNGPEHLTTELGPSDGGCPTLARQPAYARSYATRDSAGCANGTCGTSSGTVLLQGAATRPWSFDGSGRISLWRVDFDLSTSCALGTTGGECCADDKPMRLIATANAALQDGSRVELGSAFVTYAADAVASRPATWGWIKGTYR